MKRSVSTQIAEIENFLFAYKAPAFPANGVMRDSISEAYREFHCVLIWQAHLDGLPNVDPTIKASFNEATSDLSQSFLCCLMSSYKPSRMMLRSAIENVMRVVISFSGGDPKLAKTVYQLSGSFIDCPVNKGPSHSSSQSLLQLYDELCKYVHSSTPMHLDFRIPFSSITTADNAELIACAKSIRKFSSATSRIMFALRYSDISNMHHIDADWLRDRLPALLKRQVSSLYL